MTFEQAIANQWAVAYHRIVYSKENQRQCRCEDCREHLATLAERNRSLTADKSQEAVSL